MPAVVTSTNLNGLGVARVLGRRGVSVIGIHSDEPGPELRSRYLEEVWDVEPGPMALLEELLKRGATFSQPPVLIPITDESVKVVAENLEAVRRFYRVAISDGDLILKLLSKRGILEAAKQLDVTVPRTWSVSTLAELKEIAPGLPYPVVLKPQMRSRAFSEAGGRKASIHRTPLALLASYQTHCKVEPRVVVQDYVPGGDDELFFCLMWISQGGESVHWFTGRKIRQWPLHCGGVTIAEPVDVPEIVEISRDFFRRSGVWGLCSTEFKRNPRDGAFYLLEPTVGRTDWQNAMADNNGVPLAYLGYCALVGMPTPSVHPGGRGRRWIHAGADRLSAHEYRARRELTLLSWLWSLRPPAHYAYWTLDDPGPFLQIVRGGTQRALRKILRLLGLGRSRARVPSK